MKWPQALVEIVSIIAFAAVAIAFLWFHPAKADCLAVTSGTISTSSVLYATNLDRCSAGEKPLTYNKTLAQIAQERADYLNKTQVFSHQNLQGQTAVWYLLEIHDVYYNSAGENLSRDFNDNQILNTAWMQSPTHKANILNTTFTQIGVGISGRYVAVVFTGL